jgi:HEAT repeat protein
MSGIIMAAEKSESQERDAINLSEDNRVESSVGNIRMLASDSENDLLRSFSRSLKIARTFLHNDLAKCNRFLTKNGNKGTKWWACEMAAYEIYRANLAHCQALHAAKEMCDFFDHRDHQPTVRPPSFPPISPLTVPVPVSVPIDLTQTDSEERAAEVQRLIAAGDSTKALRLIMRTGPTLLPSLMRLIPHSPHSPGSLEYDFDTQWIVRTAIRRFAAVDRTVLISLLDNADENVAVEAVRQTAELGLHEAAEKLISLIMTDERPVVTDEAIRAVKELKITTAESAILKHLDSSSLNRRLLAVDALAEIGSAGLRDRILDLMSDPDLMVRHEAELAVGRLGATEALPRLLDILKADNWLHASGAVVSVGLLKATDALPSLRIIASRSNRPMRCLVASSIGNIRSADGLDILATLARDGDPRVRQNACDAIAEIGDASARDIVRPLRRDPDSEVRRTAREAWARLSVGVESGCRLTDG